MHKSFKEGDKIRAIKGYSSWFEAGDILIVESANDGYVQIKNKTGRIGGFYPKNFELADNITISGVLDGEHLVVGPHRIRLPDALLPIPDDVVKMRRAIAKYHRTMGHHTVPDSILAGDRDKAVKAALEEFNNV